MYFVLFSRSFGHLEDYESDDGIVLHDLLPMRPRAVADPDSDDDYVLDDLLPLRRHEY